MEKQKFIDTNELEKFLENDLSGELDVLSQLFLLFQSQLDEIKNQEPNDLNLKEVARIAHKIQSSAKIFTAEKLNFELRKIEQEANDQNISAALLSYQSVISFFSQTLEEVELFIKHMKKLGQSLDG